MNKKRYYIETYGCEMNKSDSIDIAVSFEENGYEQAGNVNEADVVVINTCAVRENAEERILGRLGYYRSLKKRNNKDLKIVLTGCMAQEKGERIIKIFPEIDLITGTYHFLAIPEYLKNWNGGSNLILDKDFYTFSKYRAKRREGYRAWVNIITGCSNFCSYCIVPYLRGPEKSKESVEIVREIEELVANGVKEITLLGQNVNAYGKDNGDISFIELLESISIIDGLKWIRFLTSHPKDFDENIIKRMAKLDKVCKHFHLPAQSGSDRILTLMNRRYDMAHYMDIVSAIKKYIHDYSITTDLIVGFPTETDKDFNATLELVRNVQFDDAFMYRYSERPFTSAKDINPKVNKDVSKERLLKLIEVQRDISLIKNRIEIGKKKRVLIERVSKNCDKELLCKTKNAKMVVAKTHAPIGSFIDVYINDMSGNTLRGVEI